MNSAQGDPERENDKRFSWLNLRDSKLRERFLFQWLWSLPLIGVLSIGIILVYVSQVPSGVRWSAFGTAVLIAGSSWFAGGFVGFLFGIPRTVQGSAAPERVTRYLGNTNLEQVSDWLTKIIVGVGLVQIGHIVPALSKLAETMKVPLGGLPSCGAFGLGLVITYALLGFFYFYFWSRELLPIELGNPAPQQQNDTDESAQSTDSSP